MQRLILINRFITHFTNQFPLQLDTEGIKEREDGERGGGWGLLFEGGDYFKYFRLRGVIIRGTAIIRGNKLLLRSQARVVGVYKKPENGSKIIQEQKTEIFRF